MSHKLGNALQRSATPVRQPLGYIETNPTVKSYIPSTCVPPPRSGLSGLALRLPDTSSPEPNLGDEFSYLPTANRQLIGMGCSQASWRPRSLTPSSRGYSVCVPPSASTSSQSFTPTKTLPGSKSARTGSSACAPPAVGFPDTSPPDPHLGDDSSSLPTANRQLIGTGCSQASCRPRSLTPGSRGYSVCVPPAVSIHSQCISPRRTLPGSQSAQTGPFTPSDATNLRCNRLSPRSLASPPQKVTASVEAPSGSSPRPFSKRIVLSHTRAHSPDSQKRQPGASSNTMPFHRGNVPEKGVLIHKAVELGSYKVDKSFDGASQDSCQLHPFISSAVKLTPTVSERDTFLSATSQGTCMQSSRYATPSTGPEVSALSGPQSTQLSYERKHPHEKELSTVSGVREFCGLARVPIKHALEYFKDAAKKTKLSREHFLEIYSLLVKEDEGESVSDKVKSAAFEVFDRDSNGVVDLMELMCGASLLCRGTANEKIDAAFTLFDETGDGFVTIDEMTIFLTRVLQVASSSQISRGFNGADDFARHGAANWAFAASLALQCFNDADLDCDGKLSLKEFRAWFKAPREEPGLLFTPLLSRGIAR